MSENNLYTYLKETINKEEKIARHFGRIIKKIDNSSVVLETTTGKQMRVLVPAGASYNIQDSVIVMNSVIVGRGKATSERKVYRV